MGSVTDVFTGVFDSLLDTATKQKDEPAEPKLTNDRDARKRAKTKGARRAGNRGNYGFGYTDYTGGIPLGGGSGKSLIGG